MTLWLSGAILARLNSLSCNKRKGQQMAAWTIAQWGNPAILGKPATWGCLLERCEALAAEAVETFLKGMRLQLAPGVSRPLQEGRERKLRESLADKVETDWICVGEIRIHISALGWNRRAVRRILNIQVKFGYSKGWCGPAACANIWEPL